MHKSDFSECSAFQQSWMDFVPPWNPERFYNPRGGFFLVKGNLVSPTADNTEKAFKSIGFVSDAKNKTEQIYMSSLVVVVFNSFCNYHCWQCSHCSHSDFIHYSKKRKEGYIHFGHFTKKKILGKKKTKKTITSQYQETYHLNYCPTNILFLRRERKGGILTDGLRRLLTCRQTVMTFELCATPRKLSNMTSWRFVASKTRRQNSRGGLSDTMKGWHAKTNTGNFLRAFLLYTTLWHKSPTLTAPFDKREREKKSLWNNAPFFSLFFWSRGLFLYVSRQTGLILAGRVYTI